MSEPICFEAVERICHGRARDTGVIGEDRHGNRRRIHSEQDNKNRELEVAQVVRRESTAKTLAHSLRSAKVGEREPAVHRIDLSSLFRKSEERMRRVRFEIDHAWDRSGFVMSSKPAWRRDDHDREVASP
jgi:hypothetical protein